MFLWLKGSHVMNHTDNYVLHWFSPSCGPEGPAQLNYFYEVLSSANYRGSMTSLQSGFSSNSAASSLQSRWYEANNQANQNNLDLIHMPEQQLNSGTLMEKSLN